MGMAISEPVAAVKIRSSCRAVIAAKTVTDIKIIVEKNLIENVIWMRDEVSRQGFQLTD